DGEIGVRGSPRARAGRSPGDTARWAGPCAPFDEEMARDRLDADGAPGGAHGRVALSSRSAPHRLPPEPQAAGRRRPPPRHRSARPRSPRSRPARGAPGAVHRRLHGRPHRGRRRVARPRRGIRRALALGRAHAPRRRPALFPLHPAGDDDQRDRRARPAQHHPEPFGGGMGRVCSRRAQRGALGQAARLRPGGGGARHEPPANPVSPRAAQRGAVHHRGREPPVLVVHRRRGGDKLSRIRRPAAHALAIIRNRLFGGDVSPERTATLALYHDTSEVLTGDLPSPVKEFNPQIERAYRAIEAASTEKLFALIPDPLKPGYEAFFRPDARDRAHRELVKAADKLCAYLKCLEETGAGNPEFAQAEKALRASVESLDLPEVRYFIETFVPSFRLTLDELN